MPKGIWDAPKGMGDVARGVGDIPKGIWDGLCGGTDSLCVVRSVSVGFAVLVYPSCWYGGQSVESV